MATRGSDAKVQGPATRKGAETRARLLAAAKDVFERHGFLSVRVSDITASAGISHGTFYHYFDSKGAIFRELARDQERSLVAGSEDRNGPPIVTRSPRAGIREAHRNYLGRYRDEAAIMGVIEQVSRYDADVNEARLATRQHFAETSARTCRRLQESGLADPKVDPVVAADALGAMVGRFAELWLVQGYRDYEFEKVVEQLGLLWANALRLPEDDVAATGPDRAS